MAKRLRAAGLDDASIISALERSGVSEEDAHFVVASLPGGAYGNERSNIAALPTSNGNLWVGLAMLFGGLLITIGSYVNAAPGQTYLVTWGLIIAGLVRITRGN